jgi:hypothetical protein
MFRAQERTPERDWYLRSMTTGRLAGDASMVEQLPVAEVLPGLYRAVLDAVADLELRGLRTDAAKLRADATRCYSGAWTPAAAHRMRVLRARAARIAASRRPGRRESIFTAISRRNVERTTL